MMKDLFRTALAIFMFAPFTVLAQQVDMADAMRSNGKIYVVVGVISIIFLGLAIYLIALDRRLTKLEDKEKTAS